jgi:hypothetical protein
VIGTPAFFLKTGHLRTSADMAFGVETAEDPLRVMTEMLADFVMEAEITEKIGAEPQRDRRHSN